MKISPVDWAVLVYSSASPDIAPAAQAGVDELAAAPRADGVAVGIQLGTSEGVTRRVLGGAGETVPGAPDMARPATLQDFLAWGMRAIPARHYAVVIGGHGGGFMGAVEDTARRHLMAPDEISDALAKSGLHPDVLAFNACLMAQAEVAQQMAPHAGWLVASQAEEARAGMPLGRFVTELRAATTPARAARLLVDASAGTPGRTPAMSAVDLSAAPALTDALDGLGRAMLAQPSCRPVVREQVRAMRNFFEEKPWDHPLTDMKDVGDLAARLAGDARLRGTPVARAAARVTEALSRAVADAASALPFAHGLSVYAPTEDLAASYGAVGRRVLDGYGRLDFARETCWGRAMAWVCGG